MGLFAYEASEEAIMVEPSLLFTKPHAIIEVAQPYTYARLVQDSSVGL